MLDLAYGFSDMGQEVHFLLMSAAGEFLEEARSSFKVIGLKAPRVRQALRPLASRLRSNRYDAVLVAMWPLTAVVPIVGSVARFRGQIAVSEHGVLSAQYARWGGAHRLWLKASTAWGYRSADARIGVSGGVAKDMAQLSGLGRDQFEVIHNPVRRLPTPSVQHVAVAERLWGSGRPRLLAVGRLKPVKNYPLLLRAFAALDRPDATLMFLGEGGGESELRNLALALGVSDRVRFAGFHADPTPFYMTADRFVLSSDHEGFGNVLVEALACGLPVISTDCPSGPGEILGGGRYGTLAKVGDAASLSAAIEASLSSEPDRAALKTRAQDFSIRAAAEKYLRAMGVA